MMWLKKFFLVLVVTALLFTGWENPAAFSHSDWPQFQKDEFKSGWSSIKTPVLSPRPA